MLLIAPARAAAAGCQREGSIEGTHSSVAWPSSMLPDCKTRSPRSMPPSSCSRPSKKSSGLSAATPPKLVTSPAGILSSSRIPKSHCRSPDPSSAAAPPPAVAGSSPPLLQAHRPRCAAGAAASATPVCGGSTSWRRQRLRCRGIGCLRSQAERLMHERRHCGGRGRPAGEQARSGKRGA